MLRNVLRFGTALAVSAAVVLPASAQVAPANAVQNAAAQTAWRVKNLLGTRIMLNNNTAAGVVDDVVYDQNGQIEYLIVSNEGKLVTVPFTAANFNAEQRVATINVTPQVWQTVPTYTTTTYPSFYTPTYREQIYKVYGLTPGQARRLERQIERR